MTSVAAYIDGFNLYYGMKSRYGRAYMWLDVVELVRQLRPGNDVTRCPRTTADFSTSG